MDKIEQVARAIGHARQDDPNGDYGLRMRLSFDELMRAAQAAATIYERELSELRSQNTALRRKLSEFGVTVIDDVDAHIAALKGDQ